ncbi:MAG: neutral zinc metallopeptidase [Acidimicrobiales bacterium]|nr:neutral zinc metallopeptidase [Acidimicrobiales bacterium]MCB9371670.1 neutral zinc metallopeptidase [Microthrixaceae bacterium]
MKWKPGTRSDDLRDERSSTGGRGVGGLPIPTGKGGVLVLAVVVVVALLGGGSLLGGGGGGGSSSSTGGIDITDILDGLGGAPAAPSGAADQVPGAPDPDGELVDFTSYVLDDVNATWDAIFTGSGDRYRNAELVLFRDGVRTGCGRATSAVGPFYCPPDQTAYLDLGFFRELDDRFDAPGDFAQAYVIAHEIGHHVQNLLGVSDDVRRAQRDDPARANELSVRLELQADCFAGVWGHSVYDRGALEDGDLQEGLTAAAAVGDDRIQESAGVDVDPETWTHGSSAERQEWFNRGFDTGDVAACDTF